MQSWISQWSTAHYGCVNSFVKRLCKGIPHLLNVVCSLWIRIKIAFLVFKLLSYKNNSVSDYILHDAQGVSNRLPHIYRIIKYSLKYLSKYFTFVYFIYLVLTFPLSTPLQKNCLPLFNSLKLQIEQFMTFRANPYQSITHRVTIENMSIL